MSKERGFSVPVDVIRTVAIVGVILLHAANDLTSQQMNWFEIIRWNTVTVYQSIGRLGVPLFLLLTGALLLQPSKLTEPIGVFFKKRVARIGLPFIFWGAIYFAWDFLVVNKINNQPITTNSIIQGVLTGPYYQFWYLYLLLGLYLITPILRVVMAHASRDLIKYILLLWFLGAAIVPTIALVTPLHLDTNVLTITGYVGYFILGAYLLTVQISRSKLALYTAVGIALTAIGTYVIAATVGGTEMYFFQGYLSPTLIFAAASLFLLLIVVQSPPSTQTFAVPSDMENDFKPKEICAEPPCESKGRKLLRLISVNTLALYLFHVMVLETIQKGYLGFAINGNTINSVVSVPLNTVIVLFVSLGIIVGLKKVPGLKKLVG
ncbi:MAG TPA: acyltransferase [Candidatus Acidoferrales bacterium]|nr:acyltransferase [Candidatus Acidoferrales bacterium]